MQPSIAEIFNLKNKVAIVTGGAQGIGKGIALRLAEAGACVAIADLDEQASSETIKEIEQFGVQGLFIKTNVAKFADLQQLVATTVDVFKKIDILVNNAGIFPFSPFLELTEELWDRVLEINLKGAIFCTQLVAQAMITQKIAGSIINIASIDALHPTGNLVHYDASKAGLVMATKSMALELAPYQIRLNALAPGGVATPGTVPKGKKPEELFKDFIQQIPLKRMGKPDDIALPVLFLASDASQYMTGSTLVVDGGYLLT